MARNLGSSGVLLRNVASVICLRAGASGLCAAHCVNVFVLRFHCERNEYSVCSQAKQQEEKPNKYGGKVAQSQVAETVVLRMCLWDSPVRRGPLLPHLSPTRDRIGATRRTTGNNSPPFFLCGCVRCVLSCPSWYTNTHPNPLPNPIGVCVPVYKLN